VRVYIQPLHKLSGNREERGSSMKIKCLYDVHHGRSLKKDKVYEATILEKGWFALVDESGEEYAYPPKLFDVVEDEDTKIIFSDYGIEILKRSGKYFLRTDSGKMVSRSVETEITFEDALLAQKGPQHAYEVIIKYDKIGSFTNI
jgi:hypothetical protein